MADLSGQLGLVDGSAFIPGSAPASPVAGGSASAARQPVCQVRINNSDSIAFGSGQALPPHLNALLSGVIEAEVVNNNYSSADTFSLRVALQEAPPWFDVDYLSTQTVIPLEIIMGSSPQDTLSVISGVVDDFDYDPIDNTAELRGRDYSRFFIDSKTNETWPNLTAGQIVTALAQRHGLDISLITPTLQRVGGALGNYQTQQGDGRTEWDLLSWLASHTVDARGNSYVVYVTGNKLYFGPRPTTTDYTIACDRGTTPGQPLRVQAIPGPVAGPRWGGISLKLSRNISVLRNVVVELRSAQTGGQQPLVVQYPVSPPAGEVQRYAFKVAPNLSQALLQQMAQARQQDISRHELRLSFSLPGDSLLKASSLVNLTGLSPSLNQSYFVQSVTRHFSVDGGYVMEGSAQNRAVTAGA